MRESDTYQAILDEGREEGREEGRVQGVQRTLLIQGRKKFGEPDQATRSTLFAITDSERLDRLTDRLLDVSTWSDLLQTP